MGRGDKGIAPEIPHMLHELGIDDIDIRVRESVPFMEPPYKTERQQETVKNMKKYLLSEEDFNARTEEQKEEFLTGGGDPAEFSRILEIGNKQRKTQLRQIENNEFYICRAYPVYLIKGRKPQ